MSQNFNPKSKVFELKEHEERIDKLVTNQFTATFMSNSKWKKLFMALDTNDIKLNHIMLKRVCQETPYITYMPKTEDLEGTWVSEGKNECNFFYKEIEWLELLKTHKPSNIPSQYVHQTIDIALNIISQTGLFEIENTETGLKVYGYKT